MPYFFAVDYWMIIMKTFPPNKRFLRDFISNRDSAGNEIRREKFNDQESEIASRNVPDHLVPKHGHGYPSERIIYPRQQNRRSLVCIEEAFKNVW
jgi:hypothetical protein